MALEVVEAVLVGVEVAMEEIMAIFVAKNAADFELRFKTIFGDCK